MKKIIVTFVMCLLFVTLIFLLWQNPKISNQIFISITQALDIVTNGKQQSYNEKFETNELKIGSSIYYYNTLTDNQKKIYTTIVNGAVKFRENNLIERYNYIDNDTLMNDTSIAIEAIFADHPELFYVNSNYSVSTIDTLSGINAEIKLSYDVNDNHELGDKISDIKKEIKSMISQVTANDPYNVELQIHDILAREVEYFKFENIDEVPEYCHNIYGALVEKKAVCDGFSKAYQILLYNKGIDSIMVIGRLDNQPHAWNMVCVENDWYHVDVTSDISIKDTEGVIIHPYFNVTTDQIKATHYINNPQDVPSADSQKYNYYYYSKKLITKSDDFNKAFTYILDNNTNEKMLELKIETDNVADKILNVLQTYKYPNYLSKEDVKFNYYNILSTYILFRK